MPAARALAMKSSTHVPGVLGGESGHHVTGLSHSTTIFAVYFVYMVRCADGTLYTGYTRDPQARVDVHNSGKGAKYTRSRLPVSLVYAERCESLSAALKRERELKPWRRADKEALIANVTEALPGKKTSAPPAD